MPVPSQEQGSLRNLPVIQRTLHHVISLGFRCAVLWPLGWESCRPAGRGDITATSYLCLPCTAGFISLIPIPAFSLLFSLEGRELCWRLVLAAGSTFSLWETNMGAHWLFPDGLTLLLGVGGAAQWGQGPHFSSGVNQGVCGIPCAAWEDCIYMHLHTALSNL